MQSHTDQDIRLTEDVCKKWNMGVQHLSRRRVDVRQFVMQAENRTLGEARREIFKYVCVDLHQVRQKQDLCS